MKKIDLKKNSGLSLVYENENLVTDEVKYLREKKVSIESIRPQLLNDNLQSPDYFYSKYSRLDKEDMFSNKGFKLNVYAINSNLAGIEFSKTKAIKCRHYNKIIEVVHGGGIVILQKYNNMNDNQVIINKIKINQKIIVPANYSMVLINTRQTPLIVLEYMPVKALNAIVLDEMKGMSYYVIRKNAKQEIVRNPIYKVVNDYTKIDIEKIASKWNITLKTPFIKQYLRKQEKLSKIFDVVVDDNNVFDISQYILSKKR